MQPVIYFEIGMYGQIENLGLQMYERSSKDVPIRAELIDNLSKLVGLLDLAKISDGVDCSCLRNLIGNYHQNRDLSKEDTLKLAGIYRRYFENVRYSIPKEYIYLFETGSKTGIIISSGNLKGNIDGINYDKAREKLIQEILDGIPDVKLKNLFEIYFVKFFDKSKSSDILSEEPHRDILKQIRDYLSEPNKTKEVSTIKRIGAKRVFIIHGHDELLKKEVQLLLINAELDSVVLHEQPDKGRNILDKLIEESQDACYVIALLSPDDSLANGQLRARQNVIFEIGYFLGKLGKQNIRLLVKDNIEIPSDLQGILYEPFDKSGAWKTKILKEIAAVGILFNLAKAISKI